MTRQIIDALKICIENRKKSNDVSPVISFVRKLRDMAPEGYQTPFPCIISLLVTSECNLRCKHCYLNNKDHSYAKKPDELSLQDCFKIIDEAFELKVLNMRISGGEAFCRDDIFEILEYIKQKNMALSIATNATLLNEEKIKKLKKIFNHKMDRIQISLDGASEEVHERTRGKGTYKKTINNIKLLVKNGFIVSLNCTITSYNQHELFDIYKLASSLKVDAINLNRLMPGPDEYDSLIPIEDDLVIEEARIIEYSKQSNTCTKYIGSLYKNIFYLLNLGLSKKDESLLFSDLLGNSIKEFDCSCNLGKMAINPIGEVCICEMGEELTSLGSVRKQTLTDIWNNRFSSAPSRTRKTKDFICKECEYFDACKGGCPGLSVCVYHNINTPDPRCLYAKKLLEKSK